MIELANRPLSPQDCLLIVGLPLERDAFMECMRHSKSYASSYLAKPPDLPDPEWAWTQADSVFIQPCKKALGEIEQIGSRVLFSPALKDLRSAVQNFTVVALFTHSIWQPFDATQLKDADGLVELLMFGSSLSCEIFRAWLAEFEVKNGIGIGEATSETVIEALAVASQCSHKWWAARAGMRVAGDPASLETAVVQNFCRPEIDRQFSDCVRPDEGIELRGQLHGLLEVFNELVADKKERILDLRMCNSAMTINSVKMLHPESLVVSNEWLKNPIYGLLTYKAIMQDLKNRNCSYLSACERIHTSRIRHLDS